MTEADPLTFVGLPISDGATTPVFPASSVAWSNTAAALAQFDGTVWRVLLMPTPSNGAGSTVVVNSVSTTILAANTLRLGTTLYNSGTVPIFIGLGFTPSTSLYSMMLPIGAYFEVPFGFKGAINGITSSTVGAVNVTSFT